MEELKSEYVRRTQKDYTTVFKLSVVKEPRIGTRKLYHLLHDDLQAVGVGRDKYFDILRSDKMLVKPYRSYHVTTNSHHRFRKHKNLIENMGIVGYDLSESLDCNGALRALTMANKNRYYPNVSLIHHSDRGIQYCSDAYQKQIEKYNITASMTESYDPNAIAERVNGILKQEFMLEDIKLSFKNMRAYVKEIITIYNNRRPHASCQYLTPELMHRQCDVKIKSY